MDSNIPSFWSVPTAELLSKLQVNAEGITTEEAKKKTQQLWSK
jgi:hypothetical protein